MMGGSLSEKIGYETISNTQRYQPPIDMNYLARGNNGLNYQAEKGIPKYDGLFKKMKDNKPKVGYDMPLEGMKEVDRAYKNIKNPLESLMYSMN